MNRLPTPHRFRISAPSMVYGFDLKENLKALPGLVDHVEIVLFHTSERHNIPTMAQLSLLKEIRKKSGLTYSVHLPASCDITASDPELNTLSLEQILDLIRHFHTLRPEYYILHLPITPPTLVAEPGCYIHEKDLHRYADWAKRAAAGLHHVQNETGVGRRLLVENINYSPVFLEPFWDQNLCGFCLDIGHLLLGGECVRHYLDRYLSVISEVHLHGVVGWEEHLALDVLPEERVRGWIDRLAAHRFDGIVNLEVFDPRDLDLSLKMLEKIVCKQKTVRVERS